jgi:hypothetical protein
MSKKHCSGTDLKNIHSVIWHRVFKKDCECRFLFPFMFSDCTCIHEDKGDKDQNKTLWYFLDGLVNNVYPCMVLLIQPMGCQFINAHNKPKSQRFSILTQTFKSKMHTRFSIALCIQANQHRTKIAKNKFKLGVLS